MDLDQHTGNPLVWHYTDIEGALSIIRSHTLRASWATTLNDSLEVHLGAGLISQAWREDPRASWPDTITDLVCNADVLASYVERNGFVFCASSLGDNLQHWQSYGRNGVALGLGMSPYFHTSNMVLMGVLNPDFREVDKTSAAVMYEASDTPVQRWYPVIYNPDSQVEHARQVLNNVDRVLASTPADWQEITMEDLARALLVAGVLQIKDESFRGEAEWRWIALRPSTKDAVQYRIRGGRLVPYVEITGNRGTGAQAASGAVDEFGSPSNLPLSQFRFGPDSSPGNERALADLLAAHAYPWPDYQQIRFSRLPYRSA